MYNLAIPQEINRNNKETVIAYKFGNTLYYNKDTKVLDLSNKGIENDPDRPDNFIYKSKSYNFTRIDSIEQRIPSFLSKKVRFPAQLLNDVIMLHSLCLTGNKLTKLPGSIKHLRYLRTLQLGYNKLSKLPRWIEGLKNLESLILTKNQFTSLPESIGSLTKLKELGLSGNNIESIPNNFKILRPDIKIYYKRKQYTRHEFMELFKIVKTRVSSNTDIFNKEFSITNKISNVRKNRLSYIKKNLNPNGTLKRVYSSNSLNRYMKDRNEGRLHGGTFSSNNIRKFTNKNTINKKVYLRNINIRLRNSSWNNFENTIERIKTNLPSNVSKADVNNVVSRIKSSKIKKYLLNIHANNFNRSMKMIINNYPGEDVEQTVRFIKRSRLGKIENKLWKTTSNNFNRTFNIIIKNLPYLPPVSKEDVNRIVSEIKSFRLRKIESRLMKTSVNNFSRTVKMIKSSLHATVSKEDVNNIVRDMKPQVLQKIFNKLKNSPSNKRNSIMNTMKNRGFMNQNDINNALKKLNISSTSKK